MSSVASGLKSVIIIIIIIIIIIMAVLHVWMPSISKTHRSWASDCKQPLSREVFLRKKILKYRRISLLVLVKYV